MRYQVFSCINTYTVWSALNTPGFVPHSRAGLNTVHTNKFWCGPNNQTETHFLRWSGLGVVSSEYKPLLVSSTGYEWLFGLKTPRYCTLHVVGQSIRAHTVPAGTIPKFGKIPLQNIYWMSFSWHSVLFCCSNNSSNMQRKIAARRNCMFSSYIWVSAFGASLTISVQWECWLSHVSMFLQNVHLRKVQCEYESHQIF